MFPFETPLMLFTSYLPIVLFRTHNVWEEKYWFHPKNSILSISKIRFSNSDRAHIFTKTFFPMLKISVSNLSTPSSKSARSGNVSVTPFWESNHLYLIWLNHIRSENDRLIQIYRSKDIGTTIQSEIGQILPTFDKNFSPLFAKWNFCTRRTNSNNICY